MKKHQTIAIVSIIILVIAVAVIIFVSKKSTDPQPVIETPAPTQPLPAADAVHPLLQGEGPEP